MAGTAVRTARADLVSGKSLPNQPYGPNIDSACADPERPDHGISEGSSAEKKLPAAFFKTRGELIRGASLLNNGSFVE